MHVISFCLKMSFATAEPVIVAAGSAWPCQTALVIGPSAAVTIRTLPKLLQVIGQQG